MVAYTRHPHKQFNAGQNINKQDNHRHQIMVHHIALLANITSISYIKCT